MECHGFVSTSQMENWRGMTLFGCLNNMAYRKIACVKPFIRDHDSLLSIKSYFVNAIFSVSIHQHSPCFIVSSCFIHVFGSFFCPTGSLLHTVSDLATNFTRLPVHGNDPWMLSMRRMVEEWRNAGSEQSDCLALPFFLNNLYIIQVVPGRAGGGSFRRKKNYIAKKEFAYRMCARRPTSAMPKPFLCCERAFCCSMVVM